MNFEWEGGKVKEINYLVNFPTIGYLLVDLH